MYRLDAASLAPLPLASTLSAAEASVLVPLRPVHTYSIVARDAATGDLGVAVQSHGFSVGSGVSSAEAGVGAVASTIAYGRSNRRGESSQDTSLRSR